jgi:hypothetical protein
MKKREERGTGRRRKVARVRKKSYVEGRSRERRAKIKRCRRIRKKGRRIEYV